MSKSKFNAKIKNTNSHVRKRTFTFTEKEKYIKKCAKCDTPNNIQRHHVFPRRFFGRHDNVEIVYLCDSCHKQIETLIPKYVRLSYEWYETFTKFFISVIEK